MTVDYSNGYIVLVALWVSAIAAVLFVGMWLDHVAVVATADEYTHDMCGKYGHKHSFTTNVGSGIGHSACCIRCGWQDPCPWT